jgi:hypothetical protein
MSNQPSSSEALKSTASSAASTVSQTVTPGDPNYDPNKDKDNFTKDNFTKDVHGNTMKKGDYKDQLSAAATGGEPHQPPSMAEKVLSYIPGMDSVFGEGGGKGEGGGGGEAKDGLPSRPAHDVQVVQLLRKQYQSKSGDGMPDPDEND